MNLLLLLAALLLVGICAGQNYEEMDPCTTPDGVPGACINIRGCPPLVELLRSHKNRPGAGDFLRRSICAYDGFDPIVCCPRSQGTNGNTVTNNEANGGAQVDNKNEAFGQGGPSQGPLPSPNECGFSNASHPKVVNGFPAPKGAWPWMVALAYRPSSRSTSKEPRFLCGAALITTRHVLTAAHCVHNRQDLYMARLGEHDLQSDNDGASPIDMPISGRKVHEGYNPSTFVNDIAILTLQESIRPTLRIHPICLPTSPELRSQNFIRTTPFIAGWGAKHFSGPSSSELLEVQIPVVTQEKCKEAFTRFKSAVIDERVLCAGYDDGGKDACQGDSGGPLMLPKGSTYYQIGVVSYGYRCAEPGVPGVYTRTTAFLDWITANVQ